MVSPTELLRTVVMLSQLMTLSWSSPLRGPTGTSLVMPRIVVVMGATVTQVSRWSLERRVRINAGRRLSNWTAAMVRINPTRGGVGRADCRSPGRRLRRA